MSDATDPLILIHSICRAGTGISAGYSSYSSLHYLYLTCCTLKESHVSRDSAACEKHRFNGALKHFKPIIIEEGRGREYSTMQEGMREDCSTDLTFSYQPIPL
jgi:hypothetical protein